MKLSYLCIQRPVFATVLSLVLIVLGVLGYNYLHVRYMPYTFKPEVVVSTSYPGASAQLVEQSVTHKLEKRLAETPNLDYMHSSSTQGSSEIYLNFKTISQQQFVVALSEVQSEVSEVSSNFPTAVGHPIVTTSGMGSGNFVMAIGIVDPNMTQIELSNYVNNTINREVQRVPGVSEVFTWSFQPVLRVAVNPEKLAAYNIKLSALEQVLDNNNTQFAVGNVINQTQSIPINAVVPLNSITAFQNLVVTNDKGRLIRLKDIATVKVEPLSLGGAVMQMNGKPATGLAVMSGSDANPIKVGEAVEKKLDQIRQQLPPGMKMTITFNLTRYLKASVHEVFKTIIEAIVLVCLVVLLFLGRWRVALIPIVTIPVCLIATFAIMYFLGFTINILTLLAIVLAVGMVVDDAIVILENTHRHVETGLSAIAAATKSLGEISFAVVGMTVCLLAVYVPTAFMRGETAVNFREFAFTLAASILISGFVALTLTPMMCGRLLTRHNLSRYESWLDRFFNRARQGYQTILRNILNYRWIVIVVFFVLIGCGGWLFTTLPGSLFPKMLAPFLMADVQGPATANANETFDLGKPLLKKIEALPQLNNVFTMVGGNSPVGDAENSMFMFMELKNVNANDGQIQNVLNKVNGVVATTPGISGGAFPVDLHSHSFGQKSQMSFLVLSNNPYHRISGSIQRLIDSLNKTGMFSHLQNGVKFNHVSYDLNINRNLAASLGVSINTISNTLSTLFGGYLLKTDYRLGDNTYSIYVQMPQKDMGDFSILKHIYVDDASGQQIPISRLVSVKQVLTLQERDHFNQMRAGYVYGNLSGNASLGRAVKAVQQAAKSVLPVGDSIEFTGNARKMFANNNSMALIFILGLVFIYLVLAALFESFIDPLIILFTVPVCIVGALAILKVTGGTLNTYTGIGLVTLIGLVSKHGILITQFANKLRQEGKSIREAVMGAATIRLRPILMTTSTMVLGALPLVFASGPGYNGRSQIGWVIVAGLIIGTIFSLFIVPVAYSFFAAIKKNNKSDDPRLEI